MSKSTARERPRTKTGRASRSLGQSWQAPIFLLGVLVFALVAVSAPLRRDIDAYEFSRDLQQLRDGLTQEDADIETLQYLAESLSLRQAKYTSYSGEVEYLLGSLYQRRAEQTPARADEFNNLAIKHLQRSLAVGAPGNDEAGLLFQLGQAYYQTGDLSQAIEHAERALEKGYERRAAAYGLLVQCYLHLPEPNLEAALATNQKQLLEFSDEESLASARLARGQILMAKGQFEEAFKNLDRINAHAPKAVLSEARYLQTQCCEKEGWWDKAISLWHDLLTDPASVPGGAGRIHYSLGLAHRQSGAGGEREAEKAWLEAIKAGGEVGQAAGIRLGELRLHSGNAEAAAAIKIWSQALAGLKSPRDYQNKLVELAEAREMFEAGFHVLAQWGDFQGAQELAVLYQRLAVPGEAEEKLADATDALAQAIVEAAAADDAQRQKAAALFDKAAQAYEQAARLLPFERQAKALWRGSQCYLQIGNHAKAAPMLDRFVHINTVPADRAEAWLALGQAYQAMNDREKAHQAFSNCIGIPNTIHACEAHYQIAEDYLQAGNHEQAAAMLQQSLRGFIAPGNSSMREKSLYKLAEVFYLQKKYDEAHLYLKMATTEFPANPQAVTARDRLGDCYRRLADMNRSKAKEALLEDSKKTHESLMRDNFMLSLKTYDDLARDLARLPSLAPFEEKLLRKAAFTAADLHFELTDFSEALARYQELQGKFRRQFAGLVACLRIWQCVSVMLAAPDQRALAQEAGREALNLADQDLTSMPADHEAFHDRPGGWGKTEWQNWVNQARRSLEPTADASAATPPPSN